jgi:O-acetyl-ADP-ribose deacetylase (regulator of RNase III)
MAIQEEADEQLFKMMFVPLGSNIVTSAHALPSKYIIHAVGPNMVEKA